MAQSHSKEARVYIGSRDVSGDAIRFDPTFSADVHDATTLVDTWRQFDPGLLQSSAELEAFYDAVAIASGSITKLLYDALGTTGEVISLYFGSANAVGDAGILFPAGLLESAPVAVPHTDLMKISGTFRPSGRVGGIGRLLHVKAARTTPASGSSIDNTTSSANGGRGNLHVFAITGAATIKIQHSVDNSVWADLITFTPSAIGGSTSTVTGTVNRYLRADWTPGTTITFALGFGRYATA